MNDPNSNLLILGASGMLGSTLLRYFSRLPHINVVGTARSFHSVRRLPASLTKNIKTNVDCTNPDHLLKLFTDTSPDVVLNCVGIVKQLNHSRDPLISIPINSLLPHRLANLCAASRSRLIHFSTDCVFTGNKGMYKETDVPDTSDVYGLTKLLGEVTHPNTITLRTSLIGHELTGNRSLVSWFMSQTDPVKGFSRAIFSGLPTVEIARIIHEIVLPYSTLEGLYHLSADPISKYDLLSTISKVYEKKIEIIPDADIQIDRSLDSSRFRSATGFHPKPWPELIRMMHHFR